MFTIYGKLLKRSLYRMHVCAGITWMSTKCVENILTHPPRTKLLECVTAKANKLTLKLTLTLILLPY